MTISHHLPQEDEEFIYTKKKLNPKHKTKLLDITDTTTSGTEKNNEKTQLKTENKMKLT